MCNATRTIAHVIGGKGVENGRFRRIQCQRVSVELEVGAVSRIVQILHAGLAIGGRDCHLCHRSLWNLAEADVRRSSVERIWPGDDERRFHFGLVGTVAIGIVTQVFYALCGHVQLGRQP